jgi:16S rRNA processing protein RimM
VPEWQYLGKIVNTRGIKGEVKVLSVTDFPNERFRKGATVYVRDKDDTYVPLEVANYRRIKQVDCLTFAHCLSIDDVEPYKGCALYVPRVHLPKLKASEYYYYQIIGCRVYSEQGEDLGAVEEILATGANDVWVVRSGHQELLLPVIRDVIRNVDPENKRITIHLIPGLIDDES